MFVLDFPRKVTKNHKVNLIKEERYQFLNKIMEVSGTFSLKIRNFS